MQLQVPNWGIEFLWSLHSWKVKGKEASVESYVSSVLMTELRTMPLKANPSTFSCSKEGQQHAGLHLVDHCSMLREVILLLSARVRHIWVPLPEWVTWLQKWWKVWSISHMRRCWEILGCLAWRKQGSERTYLYYIQIHPFKPDGRDEEAWTRLFLEARVDRVRAN